jgi:hypothetical protein
MARKPTKSATVDPDAHAHLEWLQSALQSEKLPQKIDYTEILSALVLYTPPQRLTGMLYEYWRYNEEAAVAAAAGNPKPARYPPDRWPQ